MKKPGCKTVALLLFIYCFVQSGLAQNKTLSDLAIKIGAGNNISTLNFFTNETIANTPNSGFLNVGLTAHINERNNHSLFAGLQMEAINYYPSLIEKTNLGFVSLLAGRTTRFDLAGNHLYLNQTNGLSLNTLVEATSSNVNTTPYYGNPFKNLNIGVFSQLQIMRAGEKTKNRKLDYGLGIEVGFKGIQIFRDADYPSYLLQNYFLQYGLSFNMSYNF